MAAKVTISIAEAIEIVPEHELKARHGVKKRPPFSVALPRGVWHRLRPAAQAAHF
jgi:hypothetical protein